jgi:hypothetical protein
VSEEESLVLLKGFLVKGEMCPAIAVEGNDQALVAQGESDPVTKTVCSASP